MLISYGGMLVVLPLLLYLLHGLWRIVACDSLVVAMAAFFAYVILASLFRVYLPTLSVVPVWLPFLYGYLWYGITAVLVFAVSGMVGRGGVRLGNLSHKMSAYLLSQASLLCGVVVLNPLLTDRPMQALMTLPPFVAIAGYLQYQLALIAMQDDGAIPWWPLIFSMLGMPLFLAWSAELLVPLLLRYL